MDIALIQQIITLVSTAVAGLGSVYHVLSKKQAKSHSDLSQKIQEVQANQIIGHTTLTNKIATAQSDLTGVASAMQGVLPAVQDLVSTVQKSQGDIASIASGVQDTVAAIKAPSAS